MNQRLDTARFLDSRLHQLEETGKAEAAPEVRENGEERGDHQRNESDKFENASYLHHRATSI